MADFETPLQQARRRIILGEALIAEQKAILERLRADGHLTEGPARLLATLEQTPSLMNEHLAHELSKEQSNAQSGQPEALAMNGSVSRAGAVTPWLFE